MFFPLLKSRKLELFQDNVSCESTRMENHQVLGNICSLGPFKTLLLISGRLWWLTNCEPNLLLTASSRFSSRLSHRKLPSSPYTEMSGRQGGKLKPLKVLIDPTKVPWQPHG